MSTVDSPTMEARTTRSRADDAPTVVVEERSGFLNGLLADTPTMVPPQEANLDLTEAEGVAAWHNTKKVVALWSNSSKRNAYASIEDLGWKKVSPANDSSFVTLVALLSVAEQTGANCNIRLEADGFIHEVYVF